MVEKGNNGDVLEINVRLSSTLLAITLGILIFLFLWAALSLGYREAAAGTEPDQNEVPASLAITRKFYLTTDGHKASGAVLVCEQGYHFASMWELLDTSNLAYAGDTGAVWPGGDLGSGPPSEMPGWIRTGYESESDSGIPGRDNCKNWMSDNSSFSGTTAQLRSDWTTGTGHYLHGWEVTAVDCSQKRAVWCIED